MKKSKKKIRIDPSKIIITEPIMIREAGGEGIVVLLIAVLGIMIMTIVSNF